MSGGQMQRVAIARALINKPKIILADEPTGSLDSDTTDKVYSLLRKIHKTYQTTFIIITHNKNIAERTDRMIELTDGNISLDIDLT
jgi:lipoprotein-releasing system ATP-binding protein